MLLDRLHRVREQVALLKREREDAVHRVAELDAGLREQHRECEVLKARVAELERENEVLRASRVAESHTVVPGTKERINELVNEIDRCLELMNAGAVA